MVRTLRALAVAAVISAAGYGTSNAAPIAPLPGTQLDTANVATTQVYYRHHRWGCHCWGYRHYWGWYPYWRNWGWAGYGWYGGWRGYGWGGWGWGGWGWGGWWW